MKNRDFRALCALLAVLLAIFALSPAEAAKKKKKNPTSAPAVTQAPRHTPRNNNKKQAPAPAENQAVGQTEDEEIDVTEDGQYSDLEHVAEYLRRFHRLPSNYITKNEARRLGWDSRLGNLWEVAPGKSIGGDRFGNYEGNLPDEKGRVWYECDIDFDGKYRNSKRILFSSDGLIYYTEDHYTTFTDITVPGTRAGP